LVAAVSYVAATASPALVTQALEPTSGGCSRRAAAPRSLVPAGHPRHSRSHRPLLPKCGPPASRPELPMDGCHPAASLRWLARVAALQAVDPGPGGGSW